MRGLALLLLCLGLAACQTDKIDTRPAAPKPGENINYKIEATSVESFKSTCKNVERVHWGYTVAKGLGQTTDKLDLREAQAYYVAHAVCLTPLDQVNATNLALAAAKASLELALIMKKAS